MSTESFPPNSRRAMQQAPNNAPLPPEGPKLEKIVTGMVIKRKKPLGRRLWDTFFSGDGGVLNYIAFEVLIPAVKDLVVDTITQGIDRAVYNGESRSRRPSGYGYRGSSMQRQHVSYNRPSHITRSPTSYGPPTPPTRRPAIQVSATDLGEVILDTDFIAQMVVEKMYEAIQEYGGVTVANLKELLGETPQYTDNKWGWGEGAEFQVKRIREGYLLILPEPLEMK